MIPTHHRKRSRKGISVELDFLEGLRRRLPNHEGILKALGDLYTRSGDYEAGMQVDERLVCLIPNQADVWYNLGCSYALVGRTDDAFHVLSRAIELGYDNYKWMLRDDDLRSLHSDMRFNKLLEQMVINQA